MVSVMVVYTFVSTFITNDSAGNFGWNTFTNKNMVGYQIQDIRINSLTGASKLCLLFQLALTIIGIISHYTIQLLKQCFSNFCKSLCGRYLNCKKTSAIRCLRVGIMSHSTLSFFPIQN